ncbi:L-alanine exporter AlaE [Palleronia rufa]|uniref:L-alanine exporter AlaE n=1 Tax=Palleronia rufa TaxID=1530186 RepID=UPI000568141E|nr:L-alanine exporter AlaE [Palleronia rufa]
MRTLVVDTLSTIFFFTVFATFSEFVIAGMDASEVLTTRLVMVPIMILTGRPYTRWRDWLFSRVRPQARMVAVATDVGAFLAFQVPVYGATLLIAGATVAQALTAIGSAILFMIILARPFGVFVDLVRRATGAKVAR